MYQSLFSRRCFLLFHESYSELQKINKYKAPRDKMTCIMNACKVIFGIIRTDATDDLGGNADDFFPLLILIILRANPPHLHSNIEYVRLLSLQHYPIVIASSSLSDHSGLNTFLYTTTTTTGTYRITEHNRK